ncbi:hypothetical protein WN55_03825 [Dufourea novaeangliae]|uniref:Uncharacterized protein n=1 Tax=Dufourea novaeangliae TaxID=178035 RepID=A0A154NYU2_DUFNO|nr:hypothetical protein WN55_03825 [Dufourea novaeangliae]
MARDAFDGEGLPWRAGDTFDEEGTPWRARDTFDGEGTPWRARDTVERTKNTNREDCYGLEKGNCTLEEVLCGRKEEKVDWLRKVENETRRLKEERERCRKNYKFGHFLPSTFSAFKKEPECPRALVDRTKWKLAAMLRFSVDDLNKEGPKKLCYQMGKEPTGTVSDMKSRLANAPVWTIPTVSTRNNVMGKGGKRVKQARRARKQQRKSPNRSQEQQNQQVLSGFLRDSRGYTHARFAQCALHTFTVILPAIARFTDLARDALKSVAAGNGPADTSGGLLTWRHTQNLRQPAMQKTSMRGTILWPLHRFPAPVDKRRSCSILHSVRERSPVTRRSTVLGNCVPDAYVCQPMILPSTPENFSVGDAYKTLVNPQGIRYERQIRKRGPTLVSSTGRETPIALMLLATLTRNAERNCEKETGRMQWAG